MSASGPSNHSVRKAHQARRKQEARSLDLVQRVIVSALVAIVFGTFSAVLAAYLAVRGDLFSGLGAHRASRRPLLLAVVAHPADAEVGWLALITSAGFSNPRCYDFGCLSHAAPEEGTLICGPSEDGLVCMGSFVSVTSRSATKQVG